MRKAGRVMRNVTESYSRVARDRCDPGTIRTESNTTDFRAVRGPRMNSLASGHVPKANGLVETGASQKPAIRAQGNAMHRVAMTRQRSQLPERVQIPYRNGAVANSSDENRPV